MPKTLSSTARAATYLLLFTAISGASSIKVGPGSPLSPRSIPTQTTPQRTEPVSPIPTEWADPTLELLVTVNALRDASRQSDFNVAQPQKLVDTFTKLQQMPSLTSDDAEAALLGIRTALGTKGQQQLAGARAQLERRVAMQLASSRLARDENQPGIAFYRLAFQVPGGQAVVKAVQEGKDFNPFKQGLPASVLKLIESRVRR